MLIMSQKQISEDSFKNSLKRFISHTEKVVNVSNKAVGEIKVRMNNRISRFSNPHLSNNFKLRQRSNLKRYLSDATRRQALKERLSAEGTKFDGNIRRKMKPAGIPLAGTRRSYPEGTNSSTIGPPQAKRKIDLCRPASKPKPAAIQSRRDNDQQEPWSSRPSQSQRSRDNDLRERLNSRTSSELVESLSQRIRDSDRREPLSNRPSKDFLNIRSERTRDNDLRERLSSRPISELVENQSQRTRDSDRREPWSSRPSSEHRENQYQRTRDSDRGEPWSSRPSSDLLENQSQRTRDSDRREPWSSRPSRELLENQSQRTRNSDRQEPWSSRPSSELLENQSQRTRDSDRREPWSSRPSSEHRENQSQRTRDSDRREPWSSRPSSELLENQSQRTRDSDRLEPCSSRPSSELLKTLSRKTTINSDQGEHWNKGSIENLSLRISSERDLRELIGRPSSQLVENQSQRLTRDPDRLWGCTPRSKLAENHSSRAAEVREEEGVYYLQSMSCTKMGIIHERYPTTDFTEEQEELIQRALLKHFKILESGHLPRFICSSFENGKVNVVCADQETRKWLVDTVLRISPWEGARLVVREMEYMEKATKVIVMVPAPLQDRDPSDILLMLCGQNTGLKANEWRVINRIDGPQCYLVCLVDNSGLEAIRAVGHKVFLGLWQITLIIPD